MKFIDGYWEMRPGMIHHYSAKVHEALLEEDALTMISGFR